MNHYHAAVAATLLSESMRGALCATTRSFYSVVSPAPVVPTPLVDGFLTIIINAVVKTVKTIKAALTTKTLRNQGLVKVVVMVKLIFTYRTCAHARAVRRIYSYSLFIFIIKNNLTILTMLVFMRISALTIDLTIPDHSDQGVIYEF